MHGICLLAVFWDWRKRPQREKAVNLVIWICPVWSLAGSTWIVLAKKGQIRQDLAMIFVYFGFGLMFFLIGRYLPKIQYNRTIGIKTKWALEDEENWNATHRLGGKVWTVCGMICMLCALIPFSGFSCFVFISAIAASVIVPAVYSWRFYRKRILDGEISKGRRSGRSLLTVGILTGATVVFIIWVLFSGNMKISYQSDAFTIETSGWKDYKVFYDTIEGITYEPDGVADGENHRRTNGFGNLKMSMGEFYSDRFGDYIRYTFNECPSCIVLEVSGKTVVINGQDRRTTEELFHTLKLHCRQ